MQLVKPHHRWCRIAVTGGPGAGKSTAADMFRRELGPRVVSVPEAATMLFMGGFPRLATDDARRYAQVSIYHVQRSLEDTHAGAFGGDVLLCDRGTVDGAAYWPGPAAGFFESLGTTHEQELRRYDAVLFFETAAAGGLSIHGGNPARVETLEQAIVIDRELRELWSVHPRFEFIAHHPSFFEKIATGLRLLAKIVDEHLDE